MSISACMTEEVFAAKDRVIISADSPTLLFIRRSFVLYL